MRRRQNTKRKRATSSRKKITRKSPPLKRWKKLSATRLDERLKATDLAEQARERAKGQHKYHLGSTGWIPPTKRGLGVVTKIVHKVSGRKLSQRDVYSMDLAYTFNDRKGKPISKTITNIGIPNIKVIRKWARKKSRVEKYGKLSDVEALNRWLRWRITKKIFEAFKEHFPYPRQQKKVKVSPAQAERDLDRIKQQRDAKLSLTLYRDTP